jgi:hypothetical protein
MIEILAHAKTPKTSKNLLRIFGSLRLGETISCGVYRNLTHMRLEDVWACVPQAGSILDNDKLVSFCKKLTITEESCGQATKGGSPNEHIHNNDLQLNGFQGGRAG